MTRFPPARLHPAAVRGDRPAPHARAAAARLPRPRTPRVLICLLVSELDPLPGLIVAIRTSYPTCEVLLVDRRIEAGAEPLMTWFADHDPRIHVARSGGWDSRDAAMAGFDWALRHGVDLTVELDAGGGYRAGDLAPVIAAAPSADLVLADRTSGPARGPAPAACALAIGRRLFSRFVLEVPVHDPGTGLRAYWASTLRLLDLPSVDAEVLPTRLELTLRAHEQGLVVREVPLARPTRHDGPDALGLGLGLGHDAPATSNRWHDRPGLAGGATA